jgi:hypothetical protein
MLPNSNLEDRVRLFWAERLGRAAQRLRAWFHVKPRVWVRPRYLGVLARPEDLEKLIELQWRAAVQRDFERRRGLRLLQGGPEEPRGAT